VLLLPSCAVGCVSADFCVVNEQHNSHRQTALFTSADASSNYFQRHDKIFSSTSKNIFEYSKNIFHATEYIFHDVEFKFRDVEYIFHDVEYIFHIMEYVFQGVGKSFSMGWKKFSDASGVVMKAVSPPLPRRCSPWNDTSSDIKKQE
jgi:hypothetical protein